MSRKPNLRQRNTPHATPGRFGEPPPISQPAFNQHHAPSGTTSPEHMLAPGQMSRNGDRSCCAGIPYTKSTWWRIRRWCERCDPGLWPCYRFPRLTCRFCGLTHSKSTSGKRFLGTSNGSPRYSLRRPGLFMFTLNSRPLGKLTRIVEVVSTSPRASLRLEIKF